jgi:hypothetical protein
MNENDKAMGSSDATGQAVTLTGRCFSRQRGTDRMQSKADLQVKVNRLSEENGILGNYMYDTMRGVKPDAKARELQPLENGENEVITGHLYRANSPCGGYIVFMSKVGKDSVNVWATLVDDTYKISPSTYNLGLRIVAERLTRERNRIAGYNGGSKWPVMTADEAIESLVERSKALAAQS